MVNEKNQNFADDLPAEQLLDIGRPYWVQCKNIRCIAMVDKEGKWKAFSNGTNLTDIINVFSMGATISSKLQTWSVIPADKNSILESANANSL